MASNIPELVLSRRWMLGYRGNIYESSEIKDKVIKFAAGLKKSGIKKGDRVAILSKNRPEWVIADLAVLSLGAVVVPIHCNLDKKTIQYILNDSNPKILITDNKGSLKGARWKRIISIDGSIGIPFEGIYKEGSIQTNVKKNDIATIVYTSGTTGKPKGVILTHNNILSNISAIRIPLENDVLLSYLPLSHMLERTAFYYQLTKGSTVHFSEGFHSLSGEIKKIRPTVMTTVPLLLEKIHFHYHWLPESLLSIIIKWKLRSLRYFVCGGAHLNAETEKFYLNLGIPIYTGYGMTETSPIISLNVPSHHKFGSAGKILKDVRVKIAGDGEILVKGPNVMKGYLNLKKKTNEVLKKGWFATGDLGKTENGYLHVTGRKKHLLVTSSGEKLSPEYVETKLRESKTVDDALIFGDDKPCIVALIVTRLSQSRVKKAIDRLNATLPSFMQIHDFRIIPKFTDDLLSITHKPKREVIEEKYKYLIEGMYNNG